MASRGRGDRGGPLLQFININRRQYVRSTPRPGSIEVVSVDSRPANNKLLQKPSTDDGHLPEPDNALTYPIRQPYHITPDNSQRICTNYFKIANIPPRLHVFTIQGSDSRGARRQQETLDLLAGYLLARHIVRHGKHVRSGGDAIVAWDVCADALRRFAPEDAAGPWGVRLEAGDGIEVGVRVLDTADLTVGAGAGYTAVPRPARHDGGAGRYSRGESGDAYNLLTKAAGAVLLRKVEGTGLAFREGSNRLFREDSMRPLGDVLVMYRGYFGSVKTSVEGPLLNYNVLTSVFYRQMALDEFMRKAADIDFRQALVGVKVEVRNPDGTLETIDGRVDEFGSPCREQRMRFDRDESVEGYYRRGKNSDPDKAGLTIPEYRHGLKYSNTPAVRVDGKWYAPEFCSIIPHQPYRRVLPPRLNSILVQCASLSADKAKRDVIDGLRCLDNGPGSVGDQAFTVDPKMLYVPFQRLSGPMLSYGPGVRIATVGGQWDIRGTRLTCRIPEREIGYIVEDCQATEQLRINHSWINRITDTLQEFGIRSRAVGVRVMTTAQLDDELAPGAATQRPGGPAPFIIGVSGGDKPWYVRFRALVDRKWGVDGIHLQAKKIEKFLQPATAAPDDAMTATSPAAHTYVGYLALKINLKRDANQWLPALASLLPRGRDPATHPTLFVGADVTHPGPGSGPAARSIAGVVGSVRGLDGAYRASARWQPARQELIRDLKDMVKERIADFSRGRRRPGTAGEGAVAPASLLYFRDGVGATQYRAVLDAEVAAIKLACAEAGCPGCAVTAVVVAKRHHTRFYPEPDVEDPPSHNPPDERRPGRPRGEQQQQWRPGPRGPPNLGRNYAPGVCVDSTVTDPWRREFYLQAHAANGVLGPARPARYFVLYDDHDRPPAARSALRPDAPEWTPASSSSGWTPAPSPRGPGPRRDGPAPRGRRRRRRRGRPSRAARPSPRTARSGRTPRRLRPGPPSAGTGGGRRRSGRREAGGRGRAGDDGLPALLHALSHTYARSAGSVSYAPPAYYADRLCGRLRVYFRDFFGPGDSRRPQPRQEAWRGMGPEARRRAGDDEFGAAWRRFGGPNPWHRDLDDSMFWM